MAGRHRLWRHATSGRHALRYSARSALDQFSALCDKSLMDASQALRSFREERGITQHELARALDVAQSTLAGWESGRRVVHYQKVHEVSEYTGIPVEVLVRRASRAAA